MINRAGHVVSMKEMRNTNRIFVEKRH